MDFKDNKKPFLSVILPVYNEKENLKPIYTALIQVLNAEDLPYEILFCEDGSTDGGDAVLREIASHDPVVKIVFLRRNFGQTAALSAGIDHAVGEIIVLLDADMQNDPQDIPKLLARLDEGYDIVSGWRRHRKDPFFTKRLPSMMANHLISWITGVHLHDHGCTLKAYRREILSGVSLYGEMHRFLSVLGHWMGAKVTEIEVNHHPRRRGTSKYSLNRIFKVALDLPVLVLMGSFLTRPIHFFGSVGIAFNFASLLCVIDVLYEKFIQGDQASDNPFLLLAIFFSIVGIQIIMIGLLAELLTRIYYESQQKKTYIIREIFQSNP